MTRARLTLTGELDAHLAPDVRERLHALIDQAPELLVVDLGQVTFMDSTILGLLVGGVRRLRERGGELRLVYPPQPVRRIFELTGLDAVFTTEPLEPNVLDDADESAAEAWHRSVVDDA